MLPHRRKELLAELFGRRWQRQRRGQSEAERRLGRDFNLLVSGQRPSHQSGACAHQRTDACSFASAGDPSNQRTPGCSSAGRDSGPLAFAFDRLSYYGGLDVIGLPSHRYARECEVEFALTFYLALRLGRDHRATDG